MYNTPTELISFYGSVFHPIGLACCSREAHNDYEFLFGCLALGRSRMGLESLPKLYLMADSSHSISNGFYESETSGNIICGVRGNYWFHCKKKA